MKEDRKEMNMAKQISKEAEIWEEILTTGDIHELEILLDLVIKDEDSKQIFLQKVKELDQQVQIENKVKINVELQKEQ